MKPAYKWIALSNTTIGMLLATVNATSILIAMPVIFRGIDINPLDPANFSYLLWLLMGYMVVSAVLVVTAGRLGDMFGRTRVYNLGFAIFTLAAIGLTFVWSRGSAGAIQVIGVRLLQASAAGLAMVLIGVTTGLQPYGGSSMGWSSPEVCCFCSAASRCWRCSPTGRRGPRSRCSTSSSSRYAPSRWATSRACSARSRAAAS